MTNTIDFKYHQGPYKPDWFDKSDPSHYDITAGTSPFNEWYGFNNDDDVHELAWLFTSQHFIDKFVFLEKENKWYDVDDVHEHLNEDKCSYFYTPKTGAVHANGREILEAESRF